MAVPKYEKLKMQYPLKGIKPLTKQQAIQARNWIIDGVKQGFKFE